MRLYFFILCSILSAESLAQRPYAPPVKHEIKLSGTYCELRTDHFHTGIDIKSKDGSTGDSLYAVSSGHIARIRIDASGYGNALYIRHSDSLVSVYAHIESLRPDLFNYIRKEMISQEVYEIDLDLTPDKFPIDQGEYIGTMGNTGHSFGPHLHFEIRSWDYKKSYNPIFFLAPYIQDTKGPKLKSLAVTGLNFQNDPTLVSLFSLDRLNDSTYSIEGTDTIQVASSKICLSLLAHDEQEGTRNQNGIYELDMWVDEELSYSFTMDSTSFETNRHINTHLNYPLWRDTKKRYHNCCMHQQNDLRIYSKQSSYTSLFQHKSRHIRIVTSDYFGNKGTLTFWIRQNGNAPIPSALYNYHLKKDQTNTLHISPYSVTLPTGSLTRDLRLYAGAVADSIDGEPNSYLQLHNCDEVLYAPLMIGRHLPYASDQHYIAHKCQNEKYNPLITRRSEDSLYAATWHMGNFGVFLDTIAPTMTLAKSGKNNFGTHHVTLEDNVWSFEELHFRLEGDGSFLWGIPETKSNSVTFDWPASIDSITVETTDPNGNRALEHFTKSKNR